MALIQVDGSGDYASLNAAIEPCTGGEVITISETWSGDDTTSIVWDQVVTVNVTGAAKNTQGYPDQANTYRHTEPAGHAFTVTAAVVINDMDIMSNSTGVSDEIFRVGDSESDVTLKRCHIGFLNGNTDQQDIVYFDGTSKTVTFDFESCMFYDVGRSIVDLFDPTSSTITVNFNSCSAINIAANGGRGDGSWVGLGDSTVSYTVTVNFYNNLLLGSETYIVGMAAITSPTLNVNADCNITNETSDNLSGQYTDSESLGSGGEVNGFSYDFSVENSDPGAGSYVVYIENGTSPYDLRLYDHANNDAKGFHTDAAGSNSGLSIPTGGDIIGTAYASPYCVGAFQIVAAGGETYTFTSGALTCTGVSLLADKANAFSSGTLTLTGTNIFANKLDTISSGSLTLTGAALLANKIGLLVSGTLSLVGTALRANKVVTIIKQTLAIAGSNLRANKVDTIISGALTLVGSSIFANKLNTIISGALTLTGSIFENGLRVIIAKGNLAIAGAVILANKTNKVLSGALTLTGQSLFSNKLNIIGPGSLILTTASVLANKVNTISSGLLSLSGSIFILNRVHIIVSGALTIAGATMLTTGDIIKNIIGGALTLTGTTILADKIVTIAKQTLSLTGAAILADKVVTVIKQTISLAGAPLFADKVNTITKQTLSLAGATILANKITTIASGALTLTGQTVASFLAIIQGIAGGALTLAGGAFNSLFTGIVNIVSGTLTLTGKAFTSATAGFGSTIKRFFDFF